MREAVVNAVAHADYAHRGAPIRVSIFDDRLEVENRGLLPFGLTVEDRVTLWTKRVAAPSADAIDRAILQSFAGGQGRLTSDVAKVVGLTPRATRLARPARGAAARAWAGDEPPGSKAAILPGGSRFSAIRKVLSRT